MLDIKRIRENPGEACKILSRRGADVSLDLVLELDARRREIIKEVDELRHQRKEKSDAVARARKEGKKEDQETFVLESRDIGKHIAELEQESQSVEEKLKNELLCLPNFVHETTPDENRVVRERGKKQEFDFQPRPHWIVGETLDIIDIPRAVRMSETRFVMLKGQGALLERALANFMIDLHTKKLGYTEVAVPYLVNRTSITGTGQLPKFENELYRSRDEELYLIPTAEVSLVNLHQGEVLSEEILPLKYAALTPCFRREAGSYGKDTKGMIRVHQFNKVELVKFSAPENSYKEMEMLLADAEEVLKLLGLSYRVVLLAAKEIGFTAAKTYDFECWMPGEKTWREVASCSNCEDFQARRLGIKVRRKKGLEYVHTLNSSGIAIGRTLAAVLESYQNKDGSVTVPDILRPYMGGLSRIER